MSSRGIEALYQYNKQFIMIGKRKTYKNAEIEDI